MNNLTISVTKFESVVTGEVEYGFIAADDMDTVVEKGWASLEAFLEEYPTAQSLFDATVNRENFWTYKLDGMEAGNVYVEHPAG